MSARVGARRHAHVRTRAPARLRHGRLKSIARAATRGDVSARVGARRHVSKTSGTPCYGCAFFREPRRGRHGPRAQLDLSKSPPSSVAVCVGGACLSFTSAIAQLAEHLTVD